MMRSNVARVRSQEGAGWCRKGSVPKREEGREQREERRETSEAIREKREERSEKRDKYNQDERVEGRVFNNSNSN